MALNCPLLQLSFNNSFESPTRGICLCTDYIRRLGKLVTSPLHKELRKTCDLSLNAQTTLVFVDSRDG